MFDKRKALIAGLMGGCSCFKSWSPPAPCGMDGNDTIIGVWYFNGHYYAARQSNPSTIYRSDDGGLTFATLVHTLPSGFMVLSPVSGRAVGGLLVIIGANTSTSAYRVTSFNGSTWTDHSSVTASGFSVGGSPSAVFPNGWVWLAFQGGGGAKPLFTGDISNLNSFTQRTTLPANPYGNSLSFNGTVASCWASGNPPTGGVYTSNNTSFSTFNPGTLGVNGNTNVRSFDPLTGAVLVDRAITSPTFSSELFLYTDCTKSLGSAENPVIYGPSATPSNFTEYKTKGDKHFGALDTAPAGVGFLINGGVPVNTAIRPSAPSGYSNAGTMYVDGWAYHFYRDNSSPYTKQMTRSKCNC